MCEDGRQKTVRKPRSGFTQDVSAREVWLASAPLHEAGKITKSGNTLKTGLEEGNSASPQTILFQSQRMSPDFYFSKPHSEVASTTHTSALKCFRKDAQRFSTFHPAGSPHKQMQDRERRSKGGHYRQTKTFIQPELYRICSNP